MKKLRVLAFTFLLLLASVGGGYLYLQRQLRVVHAPSSAPKPFEIPSGLGSREIVHLLHEHDVIKDENLALAYLVLSGDRRALRAGEYLFEKPMTIPEVMDKLVYGKIYLHRFTVPEGLTVAEIAGLWEAQGFGTAEEFASTARSSIDLSPDAAIESRRPASLEGYLFPETYSFPIRTTARQAIAAMVGRFKAVMERLKKDVPVESWPLRAGDTVILASLIEEEAALNEERPIIGSVFINRLKKKMLLQCDPTVAYGLEIVNRYSGRLLSADLKFNSPYNTYLYSGLPPGPITNPGFRSLEAAVKPSSTSFLYFVRTTEGRHTFSENLAAHNRAVAAYRAQTRRK